MDEFEVHFGVLNGFGAVFPKFIHEARFSDFVFPGRTQSEPMSNMTMLELLKGHAAPPDDHRPRLGSSPVPVFD